MEQKARLEQLKEILNYHSYRYYVLDAPEISDIEYDVLFDELTQIEQANPVWITADSPTQRVGGIVLDSFEKIEHIVPMLSLAKATEPEEVMAWRTRIGKLLPENTELTYTVEPKIDGLTVVLTYADGKLISGVTRGDGRIGEDITTNLLTIGSVPTKIPVDPNSTLVPPQKMVIRGEAYFPLDKFDQFNNEQAEAGERVYMNPRNAAAGSLRQLDSGITAQRPLAIFLYDIMFTSDDFDIPLQSDRIEYLQQLGFPVVKDVVCCNTIDDVLDTYNQWLEKRATINYEVDGLVVKVNDRPLADSLGFTGKDPRGAVAMKFPAQERTTTLLDIQVNVGRTGILAPTAVLEPVEVGGVTVQNATLHNYDEIARKDIRIGDTVILKRAGDVIPYIMGIVPEKRPLSARPVVIPSICPSCGEPTVQPEGEVAVYCEYPACPAQLVRRIEYFVSRSAMDIGSVGAKTAAQLVDAGYVRNVADLYFLKREDVLSLDGFKDKKVDNLLAGIEDSKAQTAERLLTALGIRFVGTSVSKLLLDVYPSIPSLQDVTLEQLTAIDGIGPQTAETVVRWFGNLANQQLIIRLQQANLPMEAIRTQTGDALAGLVFVITGTLPTLGRKEAEELVVKHGGQLSSSVSSKTDYLLAGEKAGSKLKKAQDIGTKIIDELAFLQLIGA